MSWPTVSLEEISESVVYGLNASATNDEHGPRFLRITDIHESSVEWNTVPSCECSEKELEKFRLSSGDIVFARTGATTGKSCLIRNCPTDSVFASYLIRVRLNEKANPEYISHFFNSPIYWAQVRSTAVGAAQPGINATKLKKMQIPLPPIDEQKRIASILDKVDEIKQNIHKMKDLKEQTELSIFLEMFGDPVANNKQWEIQKLGNVTSSIRSGSTPKGGSKNYVEDGITFFRSQNVWRNKIEFSDVAFIDEKMHSSMKKTSLKRNDILITKTGRINTENSSLGRAALFTGEDDTANINGHVYFIRLDNDSILHEFVVYILTTDIFREYIRSVCVGGIDKRQLNKDHIENFPIICPPLNLQEKFISRIKKLSLSAKNIRVNLSSNLNKSATQEMLT